MTSLQDIAIAPSPDAGLGEIVTSASSLGYDIVDLAGFLDDVDQLAKANNAALARIHESASALVESNTSVRKVSVDVIETSAAMVKSVNSTLTQLQDNSARVEQLAEWVAQLVTRMNEVARTLDSVQANTSQISSIASQVNILAINAKIEAVRAGDAGRGFAVVAEAINELSHKTREAAGGIKSNIGTLSTWVKTLQTESADVGKDAAMVLSGNSAANGALGGLVSAASDTHDKSTEIGAQADKVRTVVADFLPAFEEMHRGNDATVENIHDAHRRMHRLIDRSERILQAGVAAGGGSQDDALIQQVRRDAAEISALFEAAVDRGDISLSQLFSTQYRQISGTDPVQYMAPFTALTDQVLPPIQEAALRADDRVVFCAAVNRDGYLPTHNKKFSVPQGKDPVANAAISRNRRIFDDRVGLKAGRSEEPFLLQVYRRDMGGGVFKMMKDLSSPIVVKGRHWGGLRLAFGFLSQKKPPHIQKDGGGR